MSALGDYAVKVEKDYRDAVARGLHDAECEFHVDGFWLCNCAKRARLAKGHTEPPGELVHQYPLCPRCWNEVSHDGDGFVCEECHVSWSSTDYGDVGSFNDEYGDDLPGDRAKWLAGQAEKAKRVAEGQQL